LLPDVGPGVQFPVPRLPWRNANTATPPGAGGSATTRRQAFTFCPVPKPVADLRELRGLLKPDGQFVMFEQVWSESQSGHGRKRSESGFRLHRVENVYLDVVKIIEAVKADAT
jgi:hypothetical protein